MGAAYPDFCGTDSHRLGTVGPQLMAQQLRCISVALLHKLTFCFKCVLRAMPESVEKVIRTDSFDLGKNHLFAVSCTHRGQKNRGASSIRNEQAGFLRVPN
jgi:hypothetical protein